MRSTTLSLAVFLAVLVPALAGAAVVVDQENDTDPALPPFSHAGPTPVTTFAQTVTAGTSGQLVQVDLPIGCTSGIVTVEIVDLQRRDGLPGTRVRTSATVDSSLLPMPPDFQSITLDLPTHISRGDQFAIVVRNDTGTCAMLRGSTGDSYIGGTALFRTATTPSDAWLQVADFPGMTADFAFRTLVDVPAPVRAHPCFVTGLRGPLPFPDFLPVCRCVQDAGLREQRCALLHPSLFLFRRIPFPLEPGQAFTVKWTLTALAPLKGAIQISDVFPPGFIGPKTPLTFFAGQVPPGQSLTLESKVIAGPKSGAFRMDTAIDLGFPPQNPSAGRMRTVIEVRP